MAAFPFPYLVAIYNRGTFICGGSIIAPLWILTAAHCLERFKDPNLSIRAGSPHRTRGGVTRSVTKSYIHPSFVHETFDFDVGLLQLNTLLPRHDCIQCIPMSARPFKHQTGTLGLIAGWGRTEPDLTILPEYVQWTHVPVIDRKECKFKYSQYPVTRNMFCAEDHSGQRDACRGDSGGPFVVKGYLVGIISWGLECAGRDKPGVYTDVGLMRGWIDSVIGGDAKSC